MEIIDFCADQLEDIITGTKLIEEYDGKQEEPIEPDEEPELDLVKIDELIVTVFDMVEDYFTKEPDDAFKTEVLMECSCIIGKCLTSAMKTMYKAGHAMNTREDEIGDVIALLQKMIKLFGSTKDKIEKCIAAKSSAKREYIKFISINFPSEWANGF